jgi:hypothetical protein
MTVALGTSSCSSESCFGSKSTPNQLTPVMLSPGRARLATRPSLTGSPPLAKTIGIVVVAALAAIAEGVSRAVMAAYQIGCEVGQPTSFVQPDGGLLGWW